MWNHRKSTALSLLLCYVFAALLLVGIFVLPPLMRRIILYQPSVQAIPYTYTAYLLCVIPAGIALFCLIRMLYNLRRAEVFIEQNTAYLRCIAWCCAAVSVILLIFGTLICLVGSYTLTAACFVMSVVAIFLALILRVVKHVFAAAVSIKAENDMTI